MSAAKSGVNGQTGGCQCGAVRYRLNEVPDAEVICHCRMCQKASGGPFMAFCGVPRSSFVVSHGKISVFQSSEIAERGFCAKCGTPLTYQVLGSQRIAVNIGSLDDPNAVAPKTQYGLESRVTWLDAALTAPAESLAEWLKSRQIAAVGSRQHPDHEV
jgi:hypothetical protein